MDGVTILDLSRVLAGPWATQHLADQGATVIKVEPPGGDETRGYGPIVRGESTYFLSANRNKRSIVLDLKSEAGRAVLARLLARADVVIENFRPGKAERLGLGWEALHAAHPRLVVVALNAFGDQVAPPWRDRPGYDIVLQAMGGAAAITGHPGAPPTKNGTSVADLTAGLLITQAALLGLLQVARGGLGQRIVVNMMQAQASALAYHATRALVAGEVETQRGNAHAALVPYDFYRCTDGWIAIGCGNDAIWQRLVTALAIDANPGWARNTDRVADRSAVDSVVARALASLTVADADARLAEAGVPAGPILGVDQVLAHPAVDLVALEHPTLGALQMVGPPLRTATTRTTHAPPPTLDADRAAILAELGLEPAAQAALAEAGAFGPPLKRG